MSAAAPLPLPPSRPTGPEAIFPIRLFDGLDLVLGAEGQVLRDRDRGQNSGPQFTLAELVEQEGLAYAAWGTNLGRLLSETMTELARKIRLTGATTVDEYEARIELMEQWAEEAAQPTKPHLPPDWDEPYIP